MQFILNLLSRLARFAASIRESYFRKEKADASLNQQIPKREYPEGHCRVHIESYVNESDYPDW
jgi:hypothetical protein